MGTECPSKYTTALSIAPLRTDCQGTRLRKLMDILAITALHSGLLIGFSIARHGLHRPSLENLLKCSLVVIPVGSIWNVWSFRNS